MKYLVIFIALICFLTGCGGGGSAPGQEPAPPALIQVPAINVLNCAGSPVVAGFLADTFYQPPTSVLAGFKGTSFNTVSTIIAWSVTEKTPGQVDISPYIAQLDALANNGFCLIVLIDTSGRPLRTAVAAKFVDLNIIPSNTAPDWVGLYSAKPKSVDFFGNVRGSFDFNDLGSKARVDLFYEAVLPQLRARYGNKIIAVSPCVTGECEIKYGQRDFHWESYSDAAKADFTRWLTANNAPSGMLPIMNYPNQLGWGNPKPEPMYPYMQSFREDTLSKYACSLTAIIRKNSYPALGYFAQVFSFTDGIYATGAIEKTAQCFDAAALDYNFYNGYDVELKPEIPRFLTSYALRLGFKSIIVGLYAERFRNPTTGLVDPVAYKMITQSLAGIESSSGIAGVEVGNLEASEFANVTNIAGLVKAMNLVPNTTAQTRKVAIYASLTNSYLWQGEWSDNRQIIQDNLIATYIRLRSNPSYQVDIIGDAEIARLSSAELAAYTLVVLPHISAMPKVVRTKLRAYFDGGGKLLADMRFDAYNSDGSVQLDQSFFHSIGIGASQAYPANKTFSSELSNRTLDKVDHYAEGFLMAPIPGFKIGYKLVNGGGEGILLQGPRSTVFGFLPLFVTGVNKAWGEQLFDNEVTRLLQ